MELARASIIEEITKEHLLKIELPTGEIVHELYRFGNNIYDIIKHVVETHEHELNSDWRDWELVDTTLHVLQDLEATRTTSGACILLSNVNSTTQCVSCDSENSATILFKTCARTKEFCMNKQFTVKYYQRLLSERWFYDQYLDDKQVWIRTSNQEFISPNAKINDILGEDDNNITIVFVSEEMYDKIMV